MRKEDRKKENQLLFKLVITSVLLTAITAGIVFRYAKQQPNSEDLNAERIEITVPDPCDTGNIVIYANGGVYAFNGTFDIENDGKNGKDISIILDGYIEADYPHGVPEITQQYGP